MKKVLLTGVLCIGALTMAAQFVTYQNVYDLQEAREVPAQTVYGYFRVDNEWVRTAIKVKETSNSIYVVGYKEKETSRFAGAYVTYGNPSPWRSCNEQAQTVSVYSDGKEVAYNFDYKASIAGLGTVYF